MTAAMIVRLAFDGRKGLFIGIDDPLSRIEL